MILLSDVSDDVLKHRKRAERHHLLTTAQLLPCLELWTGNQYGNIETKPPSSLRCSKHARGRVQHLRKHVTPSRRLQGTPSTFLICPASVMLEATTYCPGDTHHSPDSARVGPAAGTATKLSSATPSKPAHAPFSSQLPPLQRMDNALSNKQW